MSDPGLDEYDDVTDDGALDYGDAAVQSGQRAVRVAQAPRVKPKKKVAPKKPARKPDPNWKAKDPPDGPHALTSSIYLLNYFGISQNYTLDDFLNYLHGSRDQADWPLKSPFLQAGVNIEPRQNGDNAWNDLGNTLNESGAIVVYWGHSFRPTKKATKASLLRPRRDSEDASADITFAQLRAILPKMNAKVFLLASCATDGCIGKVKRDTVVIATDSANNRTTNSLDWANALSAFFNSFIADNTIAKCVDAANAYFAGSNAPDDRFVIASGDSKMTRKA